VGSIDYQNDQIDGQVDLVTSPRQPGSTMKPLTYLAAFESLNWTPSTLIMDTPVEYPDNGPATGPKRGFHLTLDGSIPRYTQYPGR
jgi:membrane carboxypeptidase/penicillin-binding protein PbpC